MAIESDVLVIGGGLAGLTSALAAARAGSDVRLVSATQSSLRAASGLVDVLGYTPAGDGPLSDPFAAMPALPPEHPYRVVGVDAVREGLALFDDVAPDYRGDHTDANALVATHGGTIKPTARYPASVSAGLVSGGGDALLVGFETMVDFDAPRAAAHLDAAGVPFDVRGATVRFPGDRRADTTRAHYVELLDTNREVAVDGTERPIRSALADRVAAELDGHDRVGFPALLGDDDADGVRATLATHLDADVFEIPTGPPSIPGLRLEDSLRSALGETGASVETGNPVVDYDGEDAVERVYVEKNGARIPNSADQYVLATGGLVGKGLDAGRTRVAEPIFDCHVPHADDRYDWFADEAFGDHQFARFGVRTDDDLRPVTAGGSAEFANLRAAGSVVGGYDFAAEKSGAGVSIATGYAAGSAAAEASR